MGLIKYIGNVIGAGFQGLGGAVESGTFVEYFESGDMSTGLLMTRGRRVSTNKSRNINSDTNLISNGSGIDVQHNQCMIIVENGRIVEFCCEPGKYLYNTSTAPSCLGGGTPGTNTLGQEILKQWHAGGQRFSTQRVYFINLGIIGESIKWGTSDISFNHTKTYPSGQKMTKDLKLRGNGYAKIKIADPRKFFQNFGAQKTGGDNDGVITLNDFNIMHDLKIAINNEIGNAISTLGFENEVQYTQIGMHTPKLLETINNNLSNQFSGNNGFEFCEIKINGSLQPTDEMLKELQRYEETFNFAVNPMVAQFAIQDKMASGFEKAGENGGTGGIMGMGLGMGMMGNQMGNFSTYQQPQYGAYPNTNPYTQAPTQMPNQSVTPAMVTTLTNGWKCNCGTENNGNFCLNCGSKKPTTNGVQERTNQTWTCACGNTNPINAKFCSECGNKKVTVKKLVCDKCGWQPAEGQTVKFCPECGDIFNDADFVEV